MGGRERGGVFVKQQDEYMYRCDIPPPPVPFTRSLIATVKPNFCNTPCTHSSLLRSCPTCSFFSVKLKHVILLNYYPFSLPKSELLKTLKSNKKKKIWNGTLCLIWCLKLKAPVHLRYNTNYIQTCGIGFRNIMFLFPRTFQINNWKERAQLKILIECIIGNISLPII